MATGSLVIKISADINDFSRQLNKMTKDVRKAADTLSDMGRDMTIGVTAPVIAATAALLRFGIENEAIANRMQRQFGPATDAVNARLMQLMKVLPITHSELSNMAMGVNNLSKNMGFSTTASASLSTALIQMAGDLAAMTGKSIPDAMNALEQALQGRTRGLKQFGVALDEGIIKQEAYRIGVLRVGHELTPVGKALATYSLLQKEAANWTGQSAARMKDSEYQIALMRRDLIEMAETIGNALIPAFRVVVGMTRALIDTIAQTPPWLIKTTALILALAASIGPLLFVSAKLIAIFTTLRATIMLLMGPGALGGLLALLANPVVLGAIAAIAIALGGAIYLWGKYKKESSEAVDLKMPDLPSVQDLMKGVAATDQATGDPLQQWIQRVGLLRNELERAVRVGDRWVDSYTNLLTVQQEALKGMMDNVGKTNEWADAYARVYDEVTAIINQLQLAQAMQVPGADLAKGIARASRVQVSDEQLKFQIAGDAIQNETQLRLREQTLKLANTFDAARMATLTLAETQRSAANEMALAAATFKKQWGDLGGSARTAGATFMTSLMNSFGPVALLLKAFGAVLDGLMPFIDALFTPLAELGRVIGLMLTPYLKILFVPLKYLAIIVAWLGEVMARVSAGISTGVGRLLRALGQFINFIVPFANPGNGLVRAGNALLRFADEQYDAADQLSKARKEISKMQFGEASDSLDTLTSAANETAEALLNVPTGFKVALARLLATDPRTGEPLPNLPNAPSPWPSVPGGSGGAGGGTVDGDGGPVLVIQMDGMTVARAVVKNLRKTAQQQFGNSQLWAEVIV